MVPAIRQSAFGNVRYFGKPQSYCPAPPDGLQTSTHLGALLTSPSNPWLQVRDLSVTYAGAAIPAVDRVSFSVAAGEAVGLLGESGCGKSTLAASLLRLLPAHAATVAGSVRWQGRDLLGLGNRDLRRLRGAEISFINQEPALALNPVLRVGTQIAEVLRSHTAVPNPKARVCEILAEVGFDDPAAVYRAYPHQLSGGQRQRIGIAQALACRPRLVIADEPTSKLDAALQSELLQLFSTLRQNHGMAFLLITHDPGVLAAFADRVLVMYAGRIVEQAGVSQLFARPSHPYTTALAQIALESFTAGEGKRRFTSIAAGPVAARGCRYEPRCPDRMDVCCGSEPQVTVLDPGSSVSCFKFGHVAQPASAGDKGIR